MERGLGCAASRDGARKQSWSNVTAATELAERRKRLDSSSKRELQTRGQFLLAATERLLRSRTRLQKRQHEGATARMDAEEDDRSRWLLRTGRNCIQSRYGHGAVVAGQARQRQASRSREEGLNALFTDQSRAEVRSVAGQRLLSSLPTRHNACRGKPPDAPHGAVGERGDQGSTSGDGLLRGDLWGFFFSPRGVGLRPRSIILAKKEILAAALRGAKPKQATRFPTVVLAALKELVANAEAPVQCWGSVQLSHH